MMFLLLCFLVFVQMVESSCQLCGNETLSSAQINLSNEIELKIPDFPNVMTCADLEPILQTTDSNEYKCWALQAFVGGLCGCPSLGEDSLDDCDLCPENKSFSHPHQELPALQETFGFTPTCILLQTYLRYNQSDCIYLTYYQELDCQCSHSTQLPIQLPKKCENFTIAPNKEEESLHPFFTQVLPAKNFSTCRDLVGQSLDLSSTQCRIVQSFCGEAAVPLENSTCQLCADDKFVGSPDRDLPFLQSWFNFVPTCRFLEAWMLHNQYRCKKSRHFFETYCNCSITVTTVSLASEPENKEACEFCLSNVLQYPERELSDFEFFFGFVPTCAFVSDFLVQKEQFDRICLLARYRAVECGCQPIKSSPTVPPRCDICPHREYDLASVRDQPIYPFSDEDDDIFLPGINSIASDINVTCGGLYELAPLEPHNSYLCEVYRALNNQCGCSAGALAGWGGIWTPRQDMAATWIPRCSAILAMIGSILMLWDILPDKAKRRKTYHQIVVAIAIFDFIYALGWLPSSAAVPRTLNNGVPVGWHQSVGNKQTCTAQGFFIQLGLTSLLFSVSLVVYYKLAIVNGWKENKLKSCRWFLLGIPLFVGATLAFAGIPFYGVLLYSCHYYIDFPKHWKNLIFFAAIPIGLSLLTLAGLLVHVFLFVNRTYAASRRWSISTILRRQSTMGQQTSSGDSSLPSSRSTTPPLVKQVFWQMVSYILAFFITWPVAFAATLREDLGFTGSSLLLFVLPIQGFSDALVYFRLRIKRNIARLWFLYCQKQTEEEEERSRQVCVEPSTAIMEQGLSNE